jgi:putative inorganic carbon (hco3(-)) transporter
MTRLYMLRYPMVWLPIALLLGAMVGLLPPATSLLLIGGGGLALLILIEPRLGLLAALVAAPMKTLIDTENPSFSPPLGQLLLLFTLVVWALHYVMGNRRRLPPWPVVGTPVLLFILAAALSLPGARQINPALSELLKWIEILAIAIFVAQIGGLGWVAGAVIVAGLSQALIGIYQFFGGSGAPHLWILDYRFFRAFGGFGQPNPFGAFMGLSLALSLGVSYGWAMAAWAAYRAADRHRLREVVIPLAACLVATSVLALGLIVSWSRGAWLGFAGAAAVFAFFAPHKRWIGALLVFGAAGGLWLGAVTGLAPEALVRRITDFAQDLTGIEDVRGVPINDDNYAVIERLAHWQAAIGMANDHPWLGVGFGNYPVVYDRYALMNWPLPLGHAHNYYLNLAAETGLIGLAAYVVMWGWLMVLTWRAFQKNHGFQKGLALGLLCVWAHLAIHSLFDNLYVNNLFLHIGAMVGLIGVLYCQNNREML